MARQGGPADPNAGLARLLAVDQSTAVDSTQPYAAAASLVREQRAMALKEAAPDAAASRRARLSLLLVAAVVTIGLGYVILERFVFSKRGAEVTHAVASPAAAKLN